MTREQALAELERLRVAYEANSREAGALRDAGRSLARQANRTGWWQGFRYVRLTGQAADAYGEAVRALERNVVIAIEIEDLSRVLGGWR